MYTRLLCARFTDSREPDNLNATENAVSTLGESDVLVSLLPFAAHVDNNSVRPGKILKQFSAMLPAGMSAKDLGSLWLSFLPLREDEMEAQVGRVLL